MINVTFADDDWKNQIKTLQNYKYLQSKSIQQFKAQSKIIISNIINNSNLSTMYCEEEVVNTRVDVSEDCVSTSCSPDRGFPGLHS